MTPPDMTLRDYFAGLALPVIFKNWEEELIRTDPEDCSMHIVDNEGGTPDGIASECYAMADAMLRARESGTE
jgi:hypothetical protein